MVFPEQVGERLVGSSCGLIERLNIMLLLATIAVIDSRSIYLWFVDCKRLSELLGITAVFSGIGSPRLKSAAVQSFPGYWKPRIRRALRVSHQGACINLVALTAPVAHKHAGIPCTVEGVGKPCSR